MSEARARTWQAGDGWHIDVRGLSPPGPLVAILRLVESLGTSGGPVIVHHDRDPQLLYPELAERGWCAERIAGDPREVRLRLAPGTSGEPRRGSSLSATNPPLPEGCRK